MLDDVHRHSNRLFLASTGLGALAYLHGLSAAICEEMAHQGLAKFLCAVAVGLLLVTLLLVAAGAAQRGPEREYATALLKRQNKQDLNQLGGSSTEAPDAMAKSERPAFDPDFWLD